MKVLKTAAIVIGAVALVATGVGLALGGTAATAAAGGSTFLGMTGATWMTVGAIASVTSGVLSLGMSLMASNVGFSSEGSPLDFQTNPQSGLPFAFGRTRMSGLKIRGATAASSGSTTHNLLFFAAMLSCTPAEAIEAFKADNVTVAFNGTTGNATTLGYTDWMAQKVYLGANPQSTALSLSLKGTAFPGWTSAHKLSGRVHALWALTYDPDGNLYSGGVPEPQWIGKWAKCYDPRKDSTYPGGSGSHRIDDYSAHEWTRNGALIALKWARGHWESGKLVCGIGAPAANIRIADFVEAANVADANGWGCGGVEWTTDSKWDVFKRILQTCGAMPSRAGAMIGCRVQSPKTEIGTIAQDDFLDEIVWPAMKPRRDRFNTVLPRYRSEAHDWEVITGSAVTSSTYVTEDGGTRTKGIDFPLVQSEVGQAGFDGDGQVGQLSAYAIADSREAGPIEWTTGPKWAGLAQGDCVILDKPDDDIVSQKVVITSPPQIDPASGKVKFIGQTETDAKHSWALGESTAAPATPTLTVPAGRPSVPSTSNWSAAAVTLGDGQPGIRVSGALADPIADRLLVQYRPDGSTDWTVAPDIVGTGNKTLDIGPLDASSVYDVRIAHKAGEQTGDWLEISGITTGANGLIAAIPLGQNVIRNSDFASGLVGYSNGWDGDAALPITRGINLPGYFGHRNVAYVFATGAAPAAGKVFDGHRTIGTEATFLESLRKWALPVVPGERVYFSGLLAGHRCQGKIICIFNDGDGNNVGVEGETPLCPYDTPRFNDGNPSYATRVGAFFTVPANARFASLELRVVCPGGSPANDDPYLFYSELFLAKVPAGQTVAPAYTPGPAGGIDGDDGDPGTDALTISARPANHVVPCYANGTPKGSLPVFEIKVYQGATDVTSSASYGAATVAGLTGFGTLGDGTYWASGFTSTAKDATGYIEVPISYGGANGVARLVYSKACDGNAAVSFSKAVTSLATNGTWVTSANENVSLADGQTLDIASSGSYLATAGTYEPEVKLAYQNVTDGGAETDVSGSTAMGGSATASEPEGWATTGTLTNSTGGTKVFNIRLKSRQNSGAGDAASVSGTLGGSAA